MKVGSVVFLFFSVCLISVLLIIGDEVRVMYCLIMFISWCMLFGYLVVISCFIVLLENVCMNGLW